MPLHWNRNDDIKESDLIAFHLQDLPPRRARAVQRAIEQSAFLAAESAAIASTLATVTALETSPILPDGAMLDRSWKALRPSLAPLTASGAIMPRWRLLTVTAMLAVSAATISFFLGTHHPAPAPAYPHAISGRVSPKPVRGPIPNETPGRTGHISRQPSHPSLNSAQRMRASAPQPTDPFSEPPALQPRTPPAAISTPVLEPSLLSSLPFPPTTQPLQPPPMTTVQSGALNAAQAPVHASTQRKPLQYSGDLMLGLGGDLIASHSSVTAGAQPRTFSASPAVAALASFHQQFRPALGYRVTVSYTRPTFGYTYYGNNQHFGFSYGGAINSRIFEAAGTYVFRGPHHKRISTAADAGAALLAFVPTDPSTTRYDFRPAGVASISADYAITTRWGIRASYRAQIFRMPDFHYSGGTIPVTTTLTYSNEPSVGVTYRFGKN